MQTPTDVQYGPPVNVHDHVHHATNNVGSLPFTGFELTILIAVAVLIVGTGVALAMMSHAD